MYQGKIPRFLEMRDRGGGLGHCLVIIKLLFSESLDKDLKSALKTLVLMM